MVYLGRLNTRQAEIHGTAAIALVATLLGVAFGLSTLVTPLYLIYQQEFGFSQIALTLIYASYALGNIASLLLFGRVSDCIGRRLTALPALAVLIVATLFFLFAKGVSALYIARILSGLGIGVVSGTANAWLADLVGKRHKTLAATIGTSTNFLGLGLAALMTGLLAEYAPLPLQLPFIVYLVILCAMAALILFTKETVRPSDASLLVIRPKLSLPSEVRARFVAPGITGFGLMALVGFYAALMPTILSHDLDIKSHAVAGALFFELATVVTVVIVATQTLASRPAMLLSLALMIPATAAVVIAQVSASLWFMLVATAAVAASAGLGYRGSLQVVNQIAPENKRAAVVSTYFVCCFTGNALPVVGVGALSSLTNTTVADLAFACMIAAFAVVAVIFGLVYQS